MVEELKRLSKRTNDTKEITQVATVASNDDTTIGNLIAEAMEKVGKDGVITVEEETHRPPAIRDLCRRRLRRWLRQMVLQVTDEVALLFFVPPLMRFQSSWQCWHVDASLMNAS